MKRTDIEMTDYLKGFMTFDLGHMNMDNFKNKVLDLNYYNDLKLDVYLPETEGPHPVMMVIYGGGWISGFKQDKFVEPMLQPLNHGYACVVPDYTLGLDASYPQALIDIKQAIRWIKKNATQYNFDPNRITLWGESAGGHLCLLAGLMEDSLYLQPEEVDSSVNNLIAFYPMVNVETADRQAFEAKKLATDDKSIFEENEEMPHNCKNSVFGIFMGEHFGDAEKMKEVNPENHIKKDMPNILINHGKADMLVPYMQSVDFYNLVKEKYPDANIELEVVGGKIHTDPYFFTAENVAKIIEFIEK